MPNLALQNVYLAYGARVLLDNVDLCLNEKTKAALAGVNGAGKTTLMRILAGVQQPDSGFYFCPEGWKIGYMSQSESVDLNLSAYQEAEKAFIEGLDVEKKIAYLDGLGTPEAIDERAVLYDELILSGFYEREGLIDATLRGLGFREEQFHVPLSSLSSGWRMRAALARILLGKIDFLLLDEPSNYLDIEASDWLMSWLKRYQGGYLLISHDRYFLDQTTSETFELFCGKVKRYAGSYTAYEKKRAQELEYLLEQKKKQEERIQQIQAFVQRFRSKASKAALVQSRLKELEKMQEIKIPPNLQKVSFRIPMPPACGERALYMQDLAKSYDGRVIFSGLDMLVNKGEKVALIGENGAGKSTLMRILAGKDKDYQGFLKFGSGVQVGYFSEDTHEPFTCATVLEEAEHAAPVDMQSQVRDLLATFLFAADDVYKPIAGLSGGEKARLLLMKIFLKPFNVLLLDEPTNHLDLATKDVLLKALQDYPGTLIFVSHDRYFIENLAQYVLHVKEKPRYYHGDYAYALSQIAKENTGENQEQQFAWIKQAQAKKEAISKEEGLSENQRQRQENKKNIAQQRRRQKQEEQLLEKIDELEEEQKIVQACLADPDVYTKGEKVKELGEKLAALQAEIDDLYAQWNNL